MSGAQRPDLGRIIGSLRAEATSTDVLDRLLAVTTEVLACGHAAALVTRPRPGEQPILATDSSLALLADDRLLGSSGPTPAVVTGTLPHVLVPDVRADASWPSWSAAAARAGVRSLLCLPLTSEGTCLGTVTAYDARVGHFTADDVATARLMARHAAAAVVAARDHEDLWRVIAARRTLGYAQGILCSARVSTPATRSWPCSASPTNSGSPSTRSPSAWSAHPPSPTEGRQLDTGVLRG